MIEKFYRRAKVTLLVVALFFPISATSRADDLVTLSGKLYEKVRITEITPATIAFIHSSGAARIAFTEFGPDVQKKYRYDEAKARAWVSQIAEQQRQQTIATEKARLDARRNYAKTKAELEQMQQRLHVVYDGATGRWYPSAEAASAAREQALKDAYEAKAMQPK